MGNPYDEGFQWDATPDHVIGIGPPAFVRWLRFYALELDQAAWRRIAAHAEETLVEKLGFGPIPVIVHDRAALRYGHEVAFDDRNIELEILLDIRADVDRTLAALPVAGGVVELLTGEDMEAFTGVLADLVICFEWKAMWVVLHRPTDPTAPDRAEWHDFTSRWVKDIAQELTTLRATPPEPLPPSLEFLAETSGPT